MRSERASIIKSLTHITTDENFPSPSGKQIGLDEREAVHARQLTWRYTKTTTSFLL